MEFTCSKCLKYLGSDIDHAPTNTEVLCPDCWHTENTQELEALPEMRPWVAQMHHQWRSFWRGIRWRLDHFGTEPRK